jgi:hypothetical protein
MNWRLEGALPKFQLETVPLDITSFPLQRPEAGSRTSFLETSVGTATLTLAQHVRSPSDATITKVKEATTFIRDAVQVAIDEELNDDGCEILYGRAGLLYAFLFLRGQLKNASSPEEPDHSSSVLTTISQLTADENIKALVDDIVARGKAGAKAYADELQSEERQLVPGLMWRWHGKRYLGGAHGVGQHVKVFSIVCRC